MSRIEPALPPDDYHRLVALYNAALPYSDQRRITRNDVNYLNGAIGFVERAGGNADGLRAIRDKLAALLPST